MAERVKPNIIKTKLTDVVKILPRTQVSICGLVQHTAQIVLRQRLLRHLLQLLLPLQGQTVVLQLNAFWSSLQAFS